MPRVAAAAPLSSTLASLSKENYLGRLSNFMTYLQCYSLQTRSANMRPMKRIPTRRVRRAEPPASLAGASCMACAVASGPCTRYSIPSLLSCRWLESQQREDIHRHMQWTTWTGDTRHRRNEGSALDLRNDTGLMSTQGWLTSRY